LLLLPITIVTTLPSASISQPLHFFQLHPSLPAQPFL
jgi:hypothetical protein